jgi:tripartite-type tricarboxylate transporter receptor subunit TctC
VEQIQFALTQFLDRRTILFGLVVIPFIGRTAQGEDFPTRPIRLVVPFGAGSVADIVARKVGEKAGATLKQSFVIENRPGAGGSISAAAVAKVVTRPTNWRKVSGRTIADQP